LCKDLIIRPSNGLKNKETKRRIIKQHKINQILLSGIGATLVMTLMMLAAPMMGMPKMPIGNMLANFMHVPVFAGWIAHFVIGTLIAANYVLVFKQRFQIAPAWKGMIYSLLPFLMAQLFVMPMMGAGLFSSNTPTPFMMVIGSLLGHLIYGASLGLISEGTKNTHVVSVKS